MADWKLLSFYTANSGPAHHVETQDGDGIHNADNSQEIFCTGNNVSNCLSFLNQEWQLLGLSAVTCNNKGQPDVCCLLNRAYDLFRCYQRIYSTKEELETRLHRLSGERDHLRTSVARSKQQLEAVERKLSQETEKFRQLTSRHKVTSSKLKAEKDEFKCLQSVMQHKDLQFKHELKKKEKEINKLKDRLHQMLMDKNPDRKVGMDMMNTVQNSEGKRAQWKPGLSKQEEDMYQMLVGNYEERHRELVLENTELRDCLLAMQRELSSLLKQTAELKSVKSSSQAMQDLSDSSSSSGEQSDERNGDSKSFMTVAELNEGYYQMPYEMVRREIERAFKHTCETIGMSMKKTWKKTDPSSSPRRISVSSPPSRASTSVSSPPRRISSTPAVGKKELPPAHDVQQMQVQLSKYKDIIQQQESLIQQSLQTHSDSFLHESQVLHEKDVLAREKKMFYEEKAHFEEERKLFTEAAIKLGRERKAVQEEKMKFLKDHFLNITPFKEKQGASPVHLKEGGTRLLPATPNFVAAFPEGGRARTPNTADLYRTLGLSEVPREGKVSMTGHQAALSPGRGLKEEGGAGLEGLTPTNTNARVNLFSSPVPAVGQESD